MDQENLRSLLEQVKLGAVDIDGALDRLRHLPFEDLGFAKIDHHRALRHGMPEVIFGLGKTPEQILAIAQKLLDRSSNLLITRATPIAAEKVMAAIAGAEHFPCPNQPFTAGRVGGAGRLEADKIQHHVD